jgi:hypothetical protein
MTIKKGAFHMALLLICSCWPAFAAEPPHQLLGVQKIWDAAPHNAFTDLARFQGSWYCVFREGQGHVSPDGALRVITSTDGMNWTSAALINSPKADLRDPKLAVTPDGKLMLSGAAALHQPASSKHLSLVWFSQDGQDWSSPVEIGEPDMWLWRISWHQHQAYSVGYSTASERLTRLYTSRDGRRFEPLAPALFEEGYPNETSLVFLPDGKCLCLLRRDGEVSSAKLGSAQPPYTDWDWQDLGVKIGGPHMIRLPDGRLAAAIRLYDGAVRTSLAWIDHESGKLLEFLKLPSGGDTSYAGLVWHDDLLWISYYSSHEAKSSIYLAKVRFDQVRAQQPGGR